MSEKILRFVALELEEIVSPDPLVDVLKTLLLSRAIEEFQIMGGIVYIKPNPNKRFDLEIMALEFSKCSVDYELEKNKKRNKDS